MTALPGAPSSSSSGEICEASAALRVSMLATTTRAGIHWSTTGAHEAAGAVGEPTQHGASGRRYACGHVPAHIR